MLRVNYPEANGIETMCDACEEAGTSFYIVNIRYRKNRFCKKCLERLENDINSMLTSEIKAERRIENG